ncbi:MAG: DUF4055 domain-containing protein [Smithella sp.]|jgi:hypothetical protein
MSSKVNTQHPEYASMAAKWKRCRDTISGQDAVHAAGVLYLPKLADQTEDEYKAYKLRAQFFNAVWRTISGLSGLIFRKPPVITTSKTVELLLEDVTMSGIKFQILAQNATIETLSVGRLGVLVDHPQKPAEALTIADAEKMNLRPTMQLYPTESIINWKTERIGNQTVLSMVVLTESTAVSTDNEFEHKTETHYRVLDLTTRTADIGVTLPAPVYRVRVFRINDKKEDEQIGQDLIPLMNGKPLNFIPFFFIGVDDTTPAVDEPPLIDLVDLNLTHYRLDADHKHGLHFGGLPTAVISGYTAKEGEKLYIGSSSAWVFPDPNAKAEYLEFTGQGLEPIAKEKDRVEQQMAILGARLLTSEKKAVETAQTAQIHRAGEDSILSAIAQTISITLTRALQVFCQWAGSEEKDIGTELNREFLPPGITPQELTALLQGWQMGAPGLSDQGLFDILQKREVVASDVTLEEEQERIASKAIPRPNIE